MPVYNPLTSDYASPVHSEVGQKLCLKTDLADVQFVFNSDDESCERVPAHKLILMAGSDVFQTMFNGTWKEKNEVGIVDVSAEVFKEFLQFFYLGRVKLTMENVDGVMKLGDKYNVAGCVSVCNKFLKNNLNDGNVCRFYGLAILFDQQDLKQLCETVIGFNTKAIFNSTGFLSCDQKVLVEILKIDYLSCTEIELFEACMSWVKAVSEQDELTKELIQTQLGESFYSNFFEIRCKSMVLQEFATIFSSYGKFFTRNEYADIFQSIANEKQMTMSNKNHMKSCDSFPWNEWNLIECDRLLMKYLSIEPHHLNWFETTKFSVNQFLLLRSFTCQRIYKKCNVGLYKLCVDIPIDVTIFECSMFDDEDFQERVVQYR